MSDSHVMRDTATEMLQMLKDPALTTGNAQIVTGTALVMSNLAIAEAIDNFSVRQGTCGHGNIGVCMTCLRDALSGAV